MQISRGTAGLIAGIAVGGLGLTLGGIAIANAQDGTLPAPTVAVTTDAPVATTPAPAVTPSDVPSVVPAPAPTTVVTVVPTAVPTKEAVVAGSLPPRATQNPAVGSTLPPPPPPADMGSGNPGNWESWQQTPAPASTGK